MAAAASATVAAEASAAPATRTVRSRLSARRCDAAMSHSREVTSRNKIAENTAITLSS